MKNEMTVETLAALLNGRNYRNEITKEEVAAAKAAGLLVLFGYSDDNVELRGVFEDEVGMCDGGTIHLHRGGLLENADKTGCDRCAAQLRRDQEKCVAVACCWDASPYAWNIKLDREGAVPSAQFDIVEGNEKFCRGLVIAVKDLPEL